MIDILIFIYLAVASLMAVLMFVGWWHAGSWQALTDAANAKQAEYYPGKKPKSVTRVQWAVVNNVIFWPVLIPYSIYKVRKLDA